MGYFISKWAIIDDYQERLTKLNIDRFFFGKFVNPGT